jgi:predicted RNA-binding protein (virulence factor B family)
MIAPGTIVSLKVLQRRGPEIYVGSETTSKIALADKELPPSVQIGDSLQVFVYIDGNGHPAATAQLPLAQAGDIAWLKVAAVNYYGAFLEWGLPKELLVPFSEQPEEMKVGRYYLVKVFLDSKNRLVASAKINQWLLEQATDLENGEKVSLMIADRTALGVKAIVNHRYWGLLYQNELFRPVEKGQKLTGYVKLIRPDGKLDLTLQVPGHSKMSELTQTILLRLQDNNGFLALSDSSPPEHIYQAFGVSKKAFKQAIGTLYRQKKIIIETNRIRLAGPANSAP